MGWEEGERNLVFYADGGCISGRDHIGAQEALTETLAMCRRVGIETNLENMKVLVCTHGYIWGKWSKAVHKRRATG